MNSSIQEYGESNMLSALHGQMMDLMDKYEWITASFARYVIEHNVDIEAYA